MAKIKNKPVETSPEKIASVEPAKEIVEVKEVASNIEAPQEITEPVIEEAKEEIVEEVKPELKVYASNSEYMEALNSGLLD